MIVYLQYRSQDADKRHKVSTQRSGKQVGIYTGYTKEHAKTKRTETKYTYR